MKTHGSVGYSQGNWVIKAAPHVLIRAKRVFESAAKYTRGYIFFSDTLANSRDLAWFIQRYPLRMSKTTRAHLEARANAHIEQESAIERVLRSAGRRKPFKLALPARDYQNVAAQLALTTGSLLLADELGLGKTCSAICTLVDPAYRPALVVCPVPLQRQWQDQIKKFAPELVVHRLTSTRPYDYTGKSGQHPDVLISTYHKLAGWAETLTEKMHTVIFDEGHELRTGLKSHKGQAARMIAGGARLRLALTATPIYNYGGEIYALIETLAPGVLGTHEEFHREWCTAYGLRGHSKLIDPDAFGSYLRDAGLMLRRTRQEVGRELPELVKIPHQVDADPEWLERVQSDAAELARVILGQHAQSRGEAFRAGGQLDVLMRQATGIAKAPYVAEFVKLLLESGEQVLLFGWHHEVYRIWKERLASYDPVLYTGLESEKQKHEAKQAFIDGKAKVLIMSLRAGQGIDGLQYAKSKTIVYGELDWSPAVHEQNTARFHRDGQTDRVFAYYLISDEGSDPIIADVLGLKRIELEGLRDPGGKVGLTERVDSGEHILRLAADVLRRQGEAWPNEKNPPEAASDAEQSGNLSPPVSPPFASNAHETASGLL
jgi:superfamily II DNA or RNA helicase